VGFIGWKIYSWISKPKPAPVEIAETAPPKVVAPPVKKVEPPPGPSIEEQARMAEAAKTSALDENISSLQKKIDAQDQLYKQQISQLEKSLGTAAQNSSDMTKNLSTLQHDVATLSAAVQDLSTQLKAIREDQVNALAKLEEMEKRKTAKPKSSKITKGEAFTSPNLSVYAIIPGRAWLRTPDGKTMTVTEGDNVGEYGKVLKIDAPNGVVITSSGVALR
jgi:seryl-tRNA synthetase